MAGVHYWGCGTIYENNFVKYTGDFKNNEMHGYGELYHQNRMLQYSGYFYEGQPQGGGIENFSSGNKRYDGDYVNGTYEGSGSARYPSGDMRYIGEWQNDVAHGYGEVYINNDVVYEGYFENGISNQYEITRTNINTIYIDGRQINNIATSQSISVNEEKIMDLVIDIMPQTRAIKAFSRFMDWAEIIE